MKRLAWIGMWLALGCGGEDTKPASGGDPDAGGVGRDGGGGGDQPPVTGATRDGGMGGLDGSVAAGGSTGEGGKDAGIDGARTLSSLSAAERADLCRASTEAFLAAVTVEDECSLGAFLVATSEADCREQVRDCVADNPDTPEDARALMQECVEAGARCDAPVDLVQRCAREATEGWKQIARASSCSLVGTSAPRPASEPKLSDECAKLENDCGEF